MAEQNNNKTSHRYSRSFQFALFLTRVLYLGYLVITCLAVPQTRKLLYSGFGNDGKNTIVVPLKVCRPTNIEVDGNSYSASSAEGEDQQCMDLDLLVNACAASMVVSMLAMILFLAVDGYVRCKRTHKHKGMVSGMGLFLSFILLQTAFVSGALAKEADFYLNTYKDLIAAANEGWDAQLHGNLAVIWACTGAGIIVCIFSAVEALTTIFTSCRHGGGRDDNNNDKKRNASAADATLKTNASSETYPSSNDIEASTVLGDHTEPTVSESPYSETPSWINK